MAVAAFLLGSCSYAFDVRATAIGGRLAFVPSDDDYDCVANITITARGASRAVPAPSDDRGLVLNGGAYWYTDNPVGACVIDFPILYGSGGAAVRTAVAAKSLRPDVVYEVSTQGQGAYGSGCFRITRSRRVETLGYGPCVDEGGLAPVD